MPIPTHLAPYSRLVSDGCRTVIELCASDGNRWFDVLFSGSLDGEIIVNSPSPLLLEVCDPVSGTAFTVFDSAHHGFGPVVCGFFYSECDDLSARQMQAYPISHLKLTATLEYDEEDVFSSENDPAMYRDSFTWITVTAEDRSGRKFTLLDFETA